MDRDESHLALSLTIAKTRLLYSKLLTALATVVVNGAIMVLVVWSVVDHPTALGWFAVTVLVSITRVGLSRLYKNAADQDDVRKWLRYFLIGAVLSGLCWGAAGLLFYQHDSAFHQVFLVFILGGMVAGAATSLSSYLPAFILFAVPAILPITVQLFAEGGRVHIAMAVLLVIFVAAMTVVARTGGRALDLAEGLRIKNENLVGRLEAARQNLADSNVELERRLEENRSYSVQLETANKELESFCYSVSHDLRAPLRSLNGFSNILMQDYPDKLDSQGKVYLQRISYNSKRMAQLIRDLLMLSRITRAEMNRDRVDMSAIAREFFSLLQKTNSERKVEVSIEDSLTAEGDRRLLRQMLENLLGNAWKFTGKRPLARIEFGTTEQEESTVYFIRDNGAGFDMKYADKLFVPFQRLHGTQEFPGTGVGLCTVQRIIERHGGRIWFEGEVDRGATFYFTLHRTGEPTKD